MIETPNPIPPATPDPSCQGIGGHIDRALPDRATKALGDASDLAGELNMPEVSTGLKEAKERIVSDAFNLMVFGRFKSGKSTLINALLGPFDLDGTGKKGVMATDPLPATAILTTITYSDKPFVHAWRTDGKMDDWTFSKYLQLSTITVEGELPPELAPVREFEVGLPVPMCRNSINLLDSPGLDENNERTRVTYQGAARCDAVLVVVKSEALLGQGEIADLNKVKATGVRPFVIVNLWGDDVVNERLQRRTWKILVTDVSGEAYDESGFDKHDIYFVDARDAERARVAGDEAALATTGLSHLEERLGAFLGADRVRVHLSRHLVYGTKLLDTLAENVAFRRKSLETESADAERKAEVLAPKIEAIKARPLKIAPIFEAVIPQATTEVQTSFDTLIEGFRHDLPAICEGIHVDQDDGVLGMMSAPFKIRSITETVVAGAMRAWEDRLDAWQDEGVTQALESVVDRIEGEVRDEVTGIEQDIQGVKFAIAGGWKPGEVKGEGIPMTERVLSGLGALVLSGGNPIAGAIGGATGWRGTVGNALGGLGGILISGVLLASGVGAPIALVALIVASLTGTAVGTGFGLTARIKKEAAQKLAAQFAGATDAMRPQVAEGVRTSLTGLGEGVRKAVEDAVRQECETVESALRSAQLSKADKEAEIAKFDDATKRIDDLRKNLRDLNLEVEQTA